ncbi:MAG: hypothetical protein RL077_3736, partial [Verrucomicrobiota bacterium]
PEFSSLKKVVPAAAAFAVATAAAAHATMPKKAEGPATHRNASEHSEATVPAPASPQPPQAD